MFKPVASLLATDHITGGHFLMTNNYEVLFIVPQNIEPSLYSELSDKISLTIKEKYSGEIAKFDKWAD